MDNPGFGSQLAPSTADEIKILGGHMSHKLDIFQKFPDGQVMWIEAVDNMDDAKSQLYKLAEANPGNYFIFDGRIGCRIDIPVAYQQS